MHELLLDINMFPPVRKEQCQKGCCMSYSHVDRCKICKEKRLHK